MIEIQDTQPELMAKVGRTKSEVRLAAESLAVGQWLKYSMAGTTGTENKAILARARQMAKAVRGTTGGRYTVRTDVMGAVWIGRTA